MSEPSRSPSPVELEPVTCWPLIAAAVGFVSLGVLTVAGFAAWSALFPPPRPNPFTAPVQDATAAPVRAEQIDLPTQPLQATSTDRVVKVRREVIHRYTPTPRPPQEDRTPVPPPTAAVRPATPPRPPRQDEMVVPTYLLAPLQTPTDEVELLKQLWKHGVEIDLDAEKDASSKLFEAGKKQLQLRLDAGTKRGEKEKADLPSITKTIEDLLKGRSDLRGLPMQNEKNCQSTKEAAKVLGTMSRSVRLLQAKGEEAVRGHLEDLVRRHLEASLARRGKPQPIPVRPLEQMLQTDSPRLRVTLVSTLSAIEGKEATSALARRAVFDLSAVVRQFAVAALSRRSLDDARPIFTAALRHPWAPAVDHAAIALADLNDRKAVPMLKKMLDEPDPCQPHQEGGKWKVREVVRVNHLRNCLLCHPPSLDNRDGVVGPIPTPGKPLPRVYYSRTRDKAIRADVVYFRQDFSVMHKVDKPDKWPELQRFDYMVRTRELSQKEVDRMLAGSKKGKPAIRSEYPQRLAVRYALHALTRSTAERNR